MCGKRSPQYYFGVLMLCSGINRPMQGAPDRNEAKAIFRKRCMACHTYGKGIKLGPDLKGVTDRRRRDWLLKFIASSSSVIQSGDATATKLSRDFRQERMPDWSDLSPEQITGILNYFAVDGPLQKEPDERDATSASSAEIRAGKELFHGESALQYGGRACSTCHTIAAPKGRDGHLGPDLTKVYLKYRDRALTDFLKRPCFAREPELSGQAYLAPQEAFDLKAYMAKAAGLPIPLPPATNNRAAASEERGNR
jgi:mono/diheme cytochrome c family protein